VYFTDECRGVTVKWQDWLCEVMLCGECTYFGVFNDLSIAIIYISSNYRCGEMRSWLWSLLSGHLFLGAEEYHERRLSLCGAKWEHGTRWSECDGIPPLAFLTFKNKFTGSAVMECENYLVAFSPCCSPMI